MPRCFAWRERRRVLNGEPVQIDKYTASAQRGMPRSCRLTAMDTSQQFYLPRLEAKSWADSLPMVGFLKAREASLFYLLARAELRSFFWAKYCMFHLSNNYVRSLLQMLAEANSSHKTHPFCPENHTKHDRNYDLSWKRKCFRENSWIPWLPCKAPIQEHWLINNISLW